MRKYQIVLVILFVSFSAISAQELGGPANPQYKKMIQMFFGAENIEWQALSSSYVVTFNYEDGKYQKVKTLVFEGVSEKDKRLLFFGNGHAYYFGQKESIQISPKGNMFVIKRFEGLGQKKDAQEPKSVTLLKISGHDDIIAHMTKDKGGAIYGTCLVNKNGNIFYVDSKTKKNVISHVIFKFIELEEKNGKTVYLIFESNYRQTWKFTIDGDPRIIEIDGKQNLIASGGITRFKKTQKERQPEAEEEEVQPPAPKENMIWGNRNCLEAIAKSKNEGLRNTYGLWWGKWVAIATDKNELLYIKIRKLMSVHKINEKIVKIVFIDQKESGWHFKPDGKSEEREYVFAGKNVKGLFATGVLEKKTD